MKTYAEASYLQPGEATILMHRYGYDTITYKWVGPRNGRVMLTADFLYRISPEAKRILFSMVKIVQPVGWNLNDYAVAMRRKVSIWPLYWLWYRLKRSEDWYIARRIFWLWMRRLHLAAWVEGEYPRFRRAKP